MPQAWVGEAARPGSVPGPRGSHRDEGLWGLRGAERGHGAWPWDSQGCWDICRERSDVRPGGRPSCHHAPDTPPCRQTGIYQPPGQVPRRQLPRPSHSRQMMGGNLVSGMTTSSAGSPLDHAGQPRRQEEAHRPQQADENEHPEEDAVDDHGHALPVLLHLRTDTHGHSRLHPRASPQHEPSRNSLPILASKVTGTPVLG